MGIFGVNLREDDSFCEIEDCFEERIRLGEDAIVIAKSFLTEYNKRPDFHIVKMAIVHCLWRSNISLEKIDTIIEINLLEKNDTLYWISLGAGAEILRKRAKIVSEFKKKISMPPTKPQQWNLGKDVIKLNKGSVFWYRIKQSCYGAVVLDVQDEYYLIAISEAINPNEISQESIVDAELYTAAWFWEKNLLAKNRIHVLGFLIIEDDYNNRAGYWADKDVFRCANCGSSSTWKHEFRRMFLANARIKDVFNADSLPLFKE